jgi:hypothetical protein
MMTNIGLPNKRMHATRDTTHVIELSLVGGRVMRGVRRLRINGSWKLKTGRE